MNRPLFLDPFCALYVRKVKCNECYVWLRPPGGIMSSFLMGCYDPDSKKWCTVTKCSGGYDDAMLARLQKELDVVKISKVGEESATKHTHSLTHQ